MERELMGALAARLFVGIELNEAARAVLTGAREKLARSASGNLSDPSLYHITLCFLGQVQRVDIPRLCELIDGIEFKDFHIYTGQLGSFKGGQVVWAGVKEPCDALHTVQRELSRALRDAGFEHDSGDEHSSYTPHITLGRRMRVAGRLPEVEEAGFAVRHLTLFESARRAGVLAYIPIHRSRSHA